jgi:mono/diheme cytochrome c family protein
MPEEHCLGWVMPSADRFHGQNRCDKLAHSNTLKVRRVMTTKSTFIFLVSIVAVIVTSTAAMAQEQVTFGKNVAGILQQHCQTCHRPGTGAPMSLLTYDQVRPWAKSIKAKVSAREMPPWFLDKTIGIQHFENDISLTDEQIESIVKWVDAGAPQGNPADMPPARQFPDDQSWQFGKPDLIVTLPKELVVKATAPDWWPDVLVDPGLNEDRYIQAMQLIPTKGYQVIHHARMLVVRPGNNTRLTNTGSDAEVAEAGTELKIYQIGTGASIYPQGSGFLLKAGSKINFAFHLHSDGKADTPTNVALGLKFYPKGYKPENAVIVGATSMGFIDIRPHETNVRSDGYLTLLKPTRLLSWNPHLHLRGKAECLEAIYPNGTTETVNCARFEFNWMVDYIYAQDVAPLLPAGTVLHTIVWHDNGDSNKANPDPDAQIAEGSRSVDEMGHAWLTYYHMSDEEFKKETQERKAKQQTLTSAR